ncbi:hypothetical protein AMTR_s00057p00100990 [Amborella trichopoda]|uniref:Uncharacterized protein n=1 Tax=Amborella trichopoda TaxID=13333 RepID=U5CU37_AMBTC|nr:hypothetical protein AMTR_s00057p00100990 [Amborella trichopoda]
MPERSYIVQELMIHCRSAHNQCWSAVTPECCIASAHLHSARAYHLLLELTYTVPESTYTMPKRMIHCWSAHRHCQSAVTPDCCIVGAHLRSAGAHIYCRSAYTQYQSAVTPNSTVGAHIHSTRAL